MRSTFLTAGLLALGMGFIPQPHTNAQKEHEVLKNWFFLRNNDNALYHHLFSQAEKHLAQRAGTVSAISTPGGWKERQRWIRATLLEAIGPFPEKTPLNARVVRTVQKKGFRVEHILFESQPGFYVTSSLYIPEGVQGKAPAIVYCSGHSPEGYRAQPYQQAILNLVVKGFVVFAFDPVGQGERLEYLDEVTGSSRVGSPTREHDMPGAQAFITGSCQARYMVWDGIRAIDYLTGRPEVDTSRIGMTGRSGGGTQTAFIGAMDDRIFASAPECYITNFTRLLQVVGPPDAEQTLPRIISRGFDEPDLLAARAPKPTLLIATLNDYFNIQGARDTYKEVSRIYDAYGVSENFMMSEDIASHASTQKNREAMYAFFQKHLRNPGKPDEGTVTYLTPEELKVTGTGQLSTSLQTESVFGLNRREADRLHAARQKSAVLPEDLAAKAQMLSGYIPPSREHAPVFTGAYLKNGIRIEKYFVQGEGNYVIPYLLFVPEKPSQKAVLFLDPKGKSAAAVHEEVWALVNGGCHVLIPDLIGTGETGPGQWKGGNFFKHFEMEGVSYRIWYASHMIGRSIVGVRAGDLVRLTKLLKSNGFTEIGAVARREFSPVLLHAAVFEPSISRISLLEPFISYHSLTTQRYYTPDFIESVVPAALTAYDLPDLAACLAPRKLLIAHITDGSGKRLTQEQASAEMAVVSAAYHKYRNNLVLQVNASGNSATLGDFFADWVRSNQ